MFRKIFGFLLVLFLFYQLSSALDNINDLNASQNKLILEIQNGDSITQPYAVDDANQDIYQVEIVSFSKGISFNIADYCKILEVPRYATKILTYPFSLTEEYTDSGNVSIVIKRDDIPVVTETIILKPHLALDQQQKFRIYPNPSYGKINIDYQHYYTSNLKLEIYNVLGQKVESFNLPPGSRHILWDCRNDKGLSIGNGIYFYYLKNGQAVLKTGKLLMVR